LKLPPHYYHCFLGNGLDAVLVGYTGSMVADKVSVDRCAWYKADRYYPEDKLVMTAGRWPIDQPLPHAEGSGWYDVAPLGRTWYEVLHHGQPLTLQATTQRFVPQEGTLYSHLEYGPVQARVTTFLLPHESVLVVHSEFSEAVEVRSWVGPGVWMDDGWDTDPFYSVAMRSDAAEGQYDLGETKGIMALRLSPAPTGFGAHGNDRWLSTTGTTITQYFSIADDKQGPLDTSELERAVARGYDALRAEVLAYWRNYFAVSRLQIPDEQFQFFYDASLYHFKAMQNRGSGGLPVNNLRRTWSSHVFWDSYFIQRPYLESNHTAEALEACRFFQRTLDHARRHAREEFGAQGLKWDWEITHDGRKAYGVHLHQKEQVHNNASYANEIWFYYEFTRDVAYLREFFPILEGLAQFFLDNVIRHTEHGYETRPLVGVHESPIRVKNDGITVAGSILILRRCAEAARVLGLENDFTRRCAAVAEGLTPVLDRLYNGHYFTGSEDRDVLNMSSIAPLYPMHVVDWNDPRAHSTMRAYLGHYHDRMLGHGETESGFPWSAGVVATVLARQREGDGAWAVLEGTRPAICNFGGMTEVMERGEWNMQYFGTAQGAVCTALHNLVLQASGDDILLFPAVPNAWPHAAFENFLAAGLVVSARYANGRITGAARNPSRQPMTRSLAFNGTRRTVTLHPGETMDFDDFNHPA
jgi:hypothetical protein